MASTKSSVATANQASEAQPAAGARIAYQGELGANSHVACLERFPELESVPCATFEDALQAVKSGNCTYAMIPIGFFAIALTSFGLGTSAAPAHVFGIGAIGGMTVAVMMRATLGHTGRPLAAGRALGLAFSMLIMALGARVVGQSFGLGPLDGIDLAAALWMIAFLILALRLGPWVARPKLSAKRPTSVPHG